VASQRAAVARTFSVIEGSCKGMFSAAAQRFVHTIRQQSMFAMAPHEELRPLKAEADQRLQRALERC
jgi:hypothetical protein